MNKPVLSHTVPPEDEATFRAGVRRGIADADADAGRTVPFDKVKAWPMSWGEPDKLPPPECE